MPSPVIAANLFRQALALENAVGVDQTLTADETQDCLDAFNDVLEELSTLNLAIPSTQNQTFPTTAGKALYAIGPTAVAPDWPAILPVRINNPGFYHYGGVDFPVYDWDQLTYNLVSLKTQQQPIVQRFLYVNSFPLSFITLWPVPATSETITLSIDGIFPNIPNAATSLSFPVGYAKLFRYKLGEAILPLFGKQLGQENKAILTEMMANIQRVNKKTPQSRFDGALVSSGPTIWQRGY